MTKEKGNMLLEVLMSLGILGILLGTVSAFPYSLLRTTTEIGLRNNAAVLARREMEGLVGLQYDNWAALPASPFSNPYNITESPSGWSINSGSRASGIYTIETTFAQIFRDGNGNITESGGTLDTETLKVQVRVSWTSQGGSNEEILSSYLSDWRNGFGSNLRTKISEWLFDENSGTTANDTVGYNNGAISGASWTTGVSGSALSFNGTTNSVEVADDNTLDITDKITIEGWFNSQGPGYPFGSITDTVSSSYTFEASSISTPSILKISQDVYAVAYVDSANTGWVKTMRVGDNGQIVSAIIDSLQFDSTSAASPAFINFNGDIFLVAYSGATSHGYLRSFSINSAGMISDAYIDSLEFDNTTAIEPALTLAQEDYVAIAYEGALTQGKLASVLVETNGQIGDTVKSTFIYDSTLGQQVNMLKISDPVYVVVYRNSTGNGIIKSVSLDSNGNFGATVIDSLTFNASLCRYPEVINISGNVFAAVYGGNLLPSIGDGVITTLSIDSAGMISDSTIDNLSFDTTAGETPVIVKSGGNIFSIAYSGNLNHGYVLSIEVGNDGNIPDSSAVKDTLVFDSVSGINPTIIHGVGDSLLIAYKGTAGANGNLVSFEISTTNRGITKPGSYSLALQGTTAYATINDTYSTIGTAVSGWNQLALVYDRYAASEQLKLYINGSKVSSAELDSALNTTTLDLSIGKYFNGYIDEVSLYNEVLSATRILDLYNAKKP